MTDDSISGLESTPVPARPGKNRAWTALVLALFLLPLGVLLGQYWALGSDRSGAEQEAEKEMASLRPRRAAWGVLGTIRLEQGRINEALPLLRKASDLEAAAGDDSHDTLALVQAELKGAGEGMPGASQKAAEQALLRAETLAPKLPQGRQAATWFSAGTFWQELGRRKEAVADLSKAVALQPDDWVDDGGGQRYKSAGLSAYYQKMLAGAMEP